jgi:hypothetical protein
MQGKPRIAIIARRGLSRCSKKKVAPGGGGSKGVGEMVSPRKAIGGERPGPPSKRLVSA